MGEGSPAAIQATRRDPGGVNGPLSRSVGFLLAFFHPAARVAVAEAFLARRVGVVPLSGAAHEPLARRAGLRGFTAVAVTDAHPLAAPPPSSDLRPVIA